MTSMHPRSQSCMIAVTDGLEYTVCTGESTVMIEVTSLSFLISSPKKVLFNDTGKVEKSDKIQIRAAIKVEEKA